MLERYLVIGEGPGMFSSGLRNFAELDHALEHVFLVTENGWLRTAAELGLIGMLLYGLDAVDPRYGRDPAFGTVL